MEYSSIKLIHILSSTILFGTGVGSAFYMFAANRTRNVANIYFATKYVVIADWLFTTPTAIIQPTTGLWLINIGGYSITDRWIFLSIILYCSAGMCWIPVIFLQIKMRNMAKIALKNNTELPEDYWRMDRWWIALGSLAFPAFVIIFYLMVMKI